MLLVKANSQGLATVIQPSDTNTQILCLQLNVQQRFHSGRRSNFAGRVTLFDSLVPYSHSVDSLRSSKDRGCITA